MAEWPGVAVDVDADVVVNVVFAEASVLNQHKRSFKLGGMIKSNSHVEAVSPT